MTPHRMSPGGNYRFDRRFPGVGRIACSSGTQSLKEFRDRDRLLTRLFDNAQLEVLAAFKRGDVTIEQLVEAERQNRLRSDTLLADLKLRRPLWRAAEEVLPLMGRSPATRQRYYVSFKALRKKARRELGAKATVADLGRVEWRTLSARWGKSDADWNHLRRAVSSFLTVLLDDKHHPFRHEVMRRIPKADEGEGRVPDLTPEQFWQIVASAPEHARAPYVVLAASGMRVGEYLRCTRAHLRPATHALEVPGTKTAGSKATIYVDPDLWPWIEAGVPSPLRYKWLRAYWCRACAATGHGRLWSEPIVREGKPVITKRGKPKLRWHYQGLRLHDLRHCHGQWATDEGAPESKVQAALRHASPTMTRRYVLKKDRGEVARMVGRALGSGQRRSG